MSNLIPVEINDQLQQEVSARKLHEGLGMSRDFTNWFKYQAEKLNLREGSDFTPILAESTGGRPSIDFKVPIDIAKHICMISGGELAHQIREHFIQAERAWNSPEQVMARAVQIANQRINNLQLIIEEQKPKAEAFDTFMDGANNQKMNIVAKSLNIGRNKLFQYLRDKHILMADNTPYQEYIDRGYFVVKQKPITMGDETINKPQTFVTPKGVEYIRRILGERKAG
ncbi:Phage antirepressor protein KilAC domain [Desulfitobacterium hafniense]|uniref:Phage antirepressor protein KilAC domain n=1 Tax=Desulfitobacterium hafniense TaxID=49338 RepID=A0A098B1E0_DESHA|nr:phage antirepressor KilAC domain-containing protein [Desulfitobacterium hafniense]CDX02167.1 Phage antirepressor protein KilAC domain [Desulfitobacterium hafniense]